MISPDVSIIVAAYNAEKTIGKMIESVLEQSFSCWELLIVDDGSVDSTSRIVQSYASIDKRITLISTENNGAVIARNIGYQESKGDYICILDADDTLLMNKLKRQLQIFNNLDDSYGVVFSDTWYCDDKLNLKFLDSSLYNSRTVKADLYFSRIIMGGIFAVHSALIKKTFLGKKEIHESTHNGMIADWALWITLSTKCRFKYVPEPVCLYRQHEMMSAKTNSNNIQALQRCNTAKYITELEDFKLQSRKIRGDFFFNNGRALQKFHSNLASRWFLRSIITWPFGLKKYLALIIAIVR